MAVTKITGAGLDIDGGTDIGAAIVDADLFIIDDGAGGTIRKTAASRLKTYIGTDFSDPSSADGDTLGSASAEWSDLFLADGGIIKFGNDQDVTLTHVADAGLLLNTTMYLTFRDSALKIYSSADGQLDIDADTEVEITATTVDLNGNLDVSGTIVGASTISAGTSFVPDASDGAALGTTSLEFSDLFLADGAVINFGDDQDITLTHSADAGLTTNGTFQATTITATTAVVPDASDGAALGTTALEWSDLFLADAAVIKFGDDQDVTLTHAADASLTLAGSTAAQLIMSSGSILPSTDTDTSNSGSVTLNFQTNQNFVLTFTGNVTLANPTTETAGQSGVIVCIQDGTGSRTLSLGTDYETAAGAGITLSTAANSVDVIPYFVKAAGSIQLGAVQKAFS